MAATLVADAGVLATDVVVEIGAGTGRLTVPLSQRAREVHAIELDPVLAAGLRKRFSGHANVRVIQGDAVSVRLPREELRVVGNLPFGCSSAILRRLLDDPFLPLERGDLVVEWGAAVKRTACWPSTMLNVTRGALYEAVLARRLPARCFEPAPRVDAGLVSIRRRPVPLVPEREWAAFRALVTEGFRVGPRRAATGRLPRLRYTRVARDLGFVPTANARELDLHQWVGLHRAVREMR